MSTKYRIANRNKEPPGRWVYDLTLPSGQVEKIGPAHTYGHLIRDIAARCLGHQMKCPSEEEIETQICQRAGGYGCRQITDDGSVIPTPIIPAIPQNRTIPGPDDYGPFLWQFLHMQGTRFEKMFFQQTVQYIARILNGKTLGCVICAKHWGEFLHSYPYQEVDTARRAAVWSWHAHNHATRAREHKSNKVLSYDKAAKIYGWEVLTDQEVQETLSALKR